MERVFAIHVTISLLLTTTAAVVGIAHYYYHSTHTHKRFSPYNIVLYIIALCSTSYISSYQTALRRNIIDKPSVGHLTPHREKIAIYNRYPQPT